MKILAIGPLPPPLHGQSIADRMAFDSLARTDDVTVIDTTIERGFAGDRLPPVWSPRRLAKIAALLFRDAPKVCRRYDVHYMSVGVSFRTLMRFAPYMTAALVKGEPYVLHTHSAMLYDNFVASSPMKRSIMAFFLRRAARVIVLGDRIAGSTARIVPPSRISVCANGVDDSLFVHEPAERSSGGVVRVLFLSNLMEAKGIFELFEAFRLLGEGYTLALAGAVENEAVQRELDRLLSDCPGRVRYEGVVTGEAKRKLLAQSDILVLPSRNEGQGIVILEAYATGCAVVTDPSVGGIGDVFRDGVNGAACNHSDPRSIAEAVKCAAVRVAFFAKNNLKESLKYSSGAFAARIKNILEESLRGGSH
ncbi:MAG: glycosyltransferase family 4 protein [Rikenellaceae bacterium]|nr:glycosyltransferase family 4 protein [Rikenellaceae bacterium]